MTSDLLKKRIRPLNESSKQDSGDCVLYVMSRDQRVADNHALIAAQKHALAMDVPLVVVFSLYKSSGYRAREHYEFMLEGLSLVETDLQKLNIGFEFLVGEPKKTLKNYIESVNPEVVYFDFNPLNGPRTLQSHLASSLEVQMYVVDTHNLIPCWVASDKKEFSAATFRPKIHKKIAEFLDVPDDIITHPYLWQGKPNSIKNAKEDIKEILDTLPNNNTQHKYKSGEKAAHETLQDFIDSRLKYYADKRNDPSANVLSLLSPYLHFGQISSLRVALELQAVVNGAGRILHLLESLKMPKPEDFSNGKVASAAALLEEMIVRKELADNFCYYEPDYLKVTGAADWAQETIKAHDNDPREHLYSKEQLEKAETHDEAWNASQKEMMRTGKMHGYMRMYWAKKVKEWTPDAQTAIDILVELNDRYSMDGGDPNGYVGIMWSVCGVHDRPWTERGVFGKIRYMNYAGLQRKIDIKAYENLHKY